MSVAQRPRPDPDPDAESGPHGASPPWPGLPARRPRPLNALLCLLPPTGSPHRPPPAHGPPPGPRVPSPAGGARTEDGAEENSRTSGLPPFLQGEGRVVLGPPRAGPPEWPVAGRGARPPGYPPGLVPAPHPSPGAAPAWCALSGVGGGVSRPQSNLKHPGTCRVFLLEAPNRVGDPYICVPCRPEPGMCWYGEQGGVQ